MKGHESLISRVERRLTRWGKRGLGKAWVVAVSGGGDSVGLLRALHHLQEPLGLRLSVAHLNHGVRGDEARADAAFVAELAGSLNLPLVLGEWQPTRSGHFESDARCARYDWLAFVAREQGASVIAVGHTLDDQAETILHRIVRGTGLRGLAGIPARRELAANPRLTLVRPLLDVSRRELRDYLAALEQSFREDASNADLSRTRARIRHDLLPKLAAEYNSNVAHALVRLGSLAASFKRANEQGLRELEQAVVITRANDCLVLKHKVLRSIPRLQRTEVLRLLWRKAGWPEASMTARRWQRLAALVENDEIPRSDVGADVEVSSDRLFLVLRRCLVLASASESASAEVHEPILAAVPGMTAVPWAGGTIELGLDPGVRTGPSESIDFDQISPPLVIRVPERGDRFQPLGMNGQSMPLADFFRGRHVRHATRSRVPLLCDRNGIIWVVGHRIADRVRVSDATKRTVVLRWLDERTSAEPPA